MEKYTIKLDSVDTCYKVTFVVPNESGDYIYSKTFTEIKEAKAYEEGLKTGFRFANSFLNL